MTEFEFEGWYWCNDGAETYFKGSSDMYYYIYGPVEESVGYGGVTKGAIKNYVGDEFCEFGYLPKEYLT